MRPLLTLRRFVDVVGRLLVFVTGGGCESCDILVLRKIDLLNLFEAADCGCERLDLYQVGVSLERERFLKDLDLGS